MATLILGAAGAGVGSLLGGPAGASLGFRIGSTVGGLWEEINAAQRAEAGKLKDTHYSGSAFGAAIPRVWGGGVVGSNIIWIQADSSGNSITRHNGGSLKGLIAPSTVYYSATLAFAICQGTFTFPNGTQVTRNPKIVNIWADDEQIYSNIRDLKKIAYLSNTGQPTFDFYPGTESQAVDSIISAAHSLYPNASQGITTSATSSTGGGGTFTLTFTDPSGNTQTSAPIAWNANQSNILSALQAMSNIGTNVTTSGGGNGSGIDRVPVIVTFTGSLGGSEQNLLVANNSGLTGGQVTTYVVTQGATPTAYRGLCYGVIQNWRLSDWGNRIPNIKVELQTDPVTTGDIISDICQSCGILASQIDVSACTQSVTGFVEPNVSTGQESLLPLLTAYSIDMVDADGMLKFIPRGGSVSGTVATTDLAASQSGMQTNTDPIKRVQKSLTDIPSEIHLIYLDPDTFYQQGSQRVSRIDSPLYNSTALDLPLALDSVTAKQIAATQLDTAWLEADSFEFNVPYSYLQYQPTDVLYLPVNSNLQRVRLIEMNLAPVGEIRCTAVPDDATALTQPSNGTGGNTPIIYGAPIPTVWDMWSGYEVQTADQASPGFYIAANGSNGWSGCTVYYSLDGGSTYQIGAQIGVPSSFGVTTSALANSSTVGLDTTDTVGVDVTASFGTLTSCSTGDIAAGVNMALIGNEFVGVETCTLTGTYTYTLSNLYRGDRSSVMTGHSSGERFILVGPGLARVALSTAQVGATVYVKCLSAGQALADVTAQTVTILAATPTSTDIALGQITAPTYLSETVLASYVVSSDPGTRTPVSWTTIDLSPYIPANATEVTLYVEATDVGNDDGYQDIQVRSASGGEVYTAVGGRIYISDADLHFSNQIRVPVSGSRSIDYQVNTGFQDGWKISLQAYWAPV